MYELTQVVRELSELTPLLPEQLSAVVQASRELDGRTDALAQEMERVRAGVAEAETSLSQILAEAASTFQTGRDGIENQLSALAAVTESSQQAVSDWIGSLRQVAGSLDAAIDSARARLQEGSTETEQGRQTVESEVEQLRSQVEALGTTVEQGTDRAVASLQEALEALQHAEQEAISGTETLTDALEDLSESMKAEAQSLLDAANTGHDEAMAEVREIASSLASTREQVLGELERKLFEELQPSLSQAMASLGARLSATSAELQHAVEVLRPGREEYEHLSRTLGESEGPLTELIDSVRRAADTAGVRFA